MWPRFSTDDFRVVGHYLGSILIIFSAVMLIPMGYALYKGEYDPLFDFVLSAGVLITIGSLLRFSKLHAPGILPRQGFMIVGLVWVMVSGISALPLMLSGHYETYLDAVFEAVSAFTGTGLSVAVDLDHMSSSANLWRHIMQFLGGLGVVAIALGMGVFSRASGITSLYAAEGRSELIIDTLKCSVRFIITVSVLFVLLGTVLGLFILMHRGFSFDRAFFHSLCVTITGYSTGGFSPMTSSIIYYHAPEFEVVIMILMAGGMFSFALYGYMLTHGAREFFLDAEVRALLLWMMAILAILAASVARDPQVNSIFVVLRRHLFTIISSSSNTGFAVFYSTQMSTFVTKGAVFASILAMAVGGAANSTSGGIKGIRLAQIIRYIVADVKCALLPESAKSAIHYHHLGRQTLKEDEVRYAMTITLLFVATYLLGTMMGVIYGYAPIDALYESVSATSNTGLSTGVTSPAMPAMLKIIYILQMLLGRLEFITIAAMLVGIWISVTPRAIAYFKLHHVFHKAMGGRTQALLHEKMTVESGQQKQFGWGYQERFGGPKGQSEQASQLLQTEDFRLTHSYKPTGSAQDTHKH